jgi:hypothetical protein
LANLTTTAAVKRQLGIGANGTINTVDDDLLDVYVSQASQMIETECLRTFGTLVDTYTYDARYPVVNHRTLFFDRDFVSVDVLSNGANGTINAADYRLLPINDSPKYGLQLLDKSGLAWQVGNDGFAQNAIVVSGTAGYCTPANRPADITLAATKLAAWLYQHRDDSGDSVQVADGAIAIPAQAPTFVLRTISKYVRRVAYSEPSHT